MNSFDKLEASLTKGSYVHKPLKSKKMKSNKSSNLPNNYQKDFKQLWNDIELKIQEIERSCYEKTFDAVAEFVSKSVQFPMKQMDEIPAAVLQMGVNMPDHGNIMKCLENYLKSEENYTVILEPRKCHNFSSIMQIIDSELQNQFQEVKLSDTTKRGGSKKQNQKRIILIIQDVETFNIELLEELILNCKIYLGKLPLVLIFGMSSAMVTLQNILPHRVLCHLGIETFHSFVAAEYLTRIIEEVVISPEQPFKLGPKVFRLVVDTVLYHDFSVTNLKHLLCFSLLKHFYNNKSAALLCSESEVEGKISNLKNEELQFLKKLPSLQLYGENNPDISSNFNNSSSFKLLLSILMENFFTFQHTVIMALKVLYCLTKDLPGSPLGKQFREIYLLNLEKQLYDSAPFKKAENLLKFQSQNDLLMKLRSCMEILVTYDQNLSKDLLVMVEQSIEQLTNLMAEDFDKKFSEKPFNIENEKFASRFELQEKMRSSIKLRRSKFDSVRNEIVEKIFSFYKNIHSPAQLPLHEIFVFDEAYSCKKHLMPSPRIVLCSALSNPQYYLACSCCKTGEFSGEIPLSMIDISILYKLHLECGKLINLRDWLEAFKSVKCAEKDNKRKGSLMKTDDSKLNIRFLHAATELQLLGFIKPTKRKTDHVARLTFGTF